ncbi:Uncharacterised protein [Mycobacteroides abscessus subsp. abscessus]|nr:Uncharacterised protein [Mycobacteroides abscessus subsp. abscessus]
MFNASRPPDSSANVAACWAANVGVINPGRNATRNFSLLVSWMRAAVVTHASRHQVPVGVSTDSNPSFSAVLATRVRYSRSGARCADAVPRTPDDCSAPNTSRPSPDVGRNQWNDELIGQAPQQMSR